MLENKFAFVEVAPSAFASRNIHIHKRNWAANRRCVRSSADLSSRYLSNLVYYKTEITSVFSYTGRPEILLKRENIGISHFRLGERISTNPLDVFVNLPKGLMKELKKKKKKKEKKEKRKKKKKK